MFEIAGPQPEQTPLHQVSIAEAVQIREAGPIGGGSKQVNSDNCILRVSSEGRPRGTIEAFGDLSRSKVYCTGAVRRWGSGIGHANGDRGAARWTTNKTP